MITLGGVKGTDGRNRTEDRDKTSDEDTVQYEDGVVCCLLNLLSTTWLGGFWWGFFFPALFSVAHKITTAALSPLCS